jgi:hypothetical protein
MLSILEKGYGGVEMILLAQDKDKRLSVVSTEMNF